MTRFFGGMGGSGAGSRFGGSKDKKAMTNLEKAMALRKDGNSNKKTSEMTGEERYKKLISDKMEAHKSRLMQQKKFSHNLPGTKPMDQEISKGAQMAMELVAAKMAKREMKKKKGADPIEIKPTPIGGMYTGFIDAKGNVWNNQNKKVLTIDKKTGAIKTTGMFGRKIGKFDPKSSFCFYKIQKELEKFALKHGSGANNIWGQQAGSKPASDPGSIYGSSPGWGSSDDGGNKGWW